MNQYDRLEKLITKEKLRNLQSKTILIVGLGGVGGYATESLARCGFKKLVLADFDTFDISNLNRQLQALKSNLNEFKTDVIAKRIKDIDPEIEVIKINQKITKEDIDSLFNIKIDYIVDACDDLDVKKELIKESITRNIKLISSMGTANKLDATKLKITTLDKTSYDPLAKILRKFAKVEKLKPKKINVISSEEKPHKTKELGTVSYLPAVAGLLCTNFIIDDILKK